MKHQAYAVVMVLLCGLLVSMVCVLIFGEPRARGASLGTWLSRGISGDGGSTTEEAIREIGPKAVPGLLERLRAENSPWMNWIIQQMDGRLFGSTYAPYQHMQAVYGFEVLGSRAAAAVPELSRMLADPKYGERASSALAAIGEPARPILCAALTNADPALRMSAIAALTSRTETPPEVVKTLRLHWRDTNARVRAVFVQRLARVERSGAADIVSEALLDSDPFVQRSALFQLQSYSLTSAVPAVLPLFTNSDPKLSRLAENVIRRLSPALAAAHGFDTNSPAVPANRFHNRRRPGMPPGEPVP